MESVDPQAISRETQRLIAESLAVLARARKSLAETEETIELLREECKALRRRLRSPQFVPVVIGSGRFPEDN